MGCAVVIGASGGIGEALVRALLRRPEFVAVVALSRAGAAPADVVSDRLIRGRIDLLDEASIEGAVCRGRSPPPARRQPWCWSRPGCCTARASASRSAAGDRSMATR